MPEIFGTTLFGPITIGHLVGVLAVVILVRVLLRLFSKGPAESKHLVQRQCSACRWSGSVSKFNLTCPKCAKKL